MKKNILFVLGMLGAGLLLSSCSDLSNFNEEKSSNGRSGRISISLGLANPDGSAASEAESARSVMPRSEDNNDTRSLSEISLYSKLSSAGDYTLLKTWDSVAEMQKSPYSESIESGTYDFKLTAKNYGATMAQELKSKAISSGSTTSLAFTALAPSSEGEQTGGIYVFAEYRDSTYTSYVAEDLKAFASTSSSPYPVCSVKLDSGDALTKSSSEYSKNAKGSDGSSCEFTGTGFSSFTNNAVPAGNHILTYTFTSTDGKVFVYPVAVQVKAGYLSSANIYPLYDCTNAAISGESYTLTYNANTGSSSAPVTQKFAGSATVADAESLGFAAASSSQRFKYWTTDEAGSGTKYYAGDSLALAGNTTLYAQWGTFCKVSYFVNLDGKTDSYVQQFENGNSLVTSSSAFASLDSSNYTFCGWDTKADGSGSRHAESDKPAITEDTVLYAQWCGAKITSGIWANYYEVKDAKQWNALMASPLANTSSGTISANVYVSGNIAEPAISITKSKTFSGKIYGQGKTISGLTGVLFNETAADSEISSLTVKGPVCNTNKGKISSVTVSGISFTGSGDYAGAICGQNQGTLENCVVSNCTVNGNTNGVKYTGGLCGYNSGTISGSSTKVTGTVTGSSKDQTFTGGYCAYNSGTISDSGSVDITLTGSSQENSHYGYVVGYNNGGTVSTEITTAAQETILNTGTIEVDDNFSKSITLSRTSLVTFVATDTTANGAKLNADIKNSKGISISNFSSENIKDSSITKKAYLPKGTYSVYLSEDYHLGKNTGCSAKVIID